MMEETVAANEIASSSSSSASAPSSSSGASLAPTSDTSAAMGFYIAIGCACGLIAALLALTSVLYVRNRKRRQHSSIIE